MREKEFVEIIISNNTNETLRDIQISYSEKYEVIEVLKIKSGYDKTIFLKLNLEKNPIDLNILYNNEKFELYKNLNVEDGIKVLLEFLKEDNKMLINKKIVINV